MFINILTVIEHISSSSSTSHGLRLAAVFMIYLINIIPNVFQIQNKHQVSCHVSHK